MTLVELPPFQIGTIVALEGNPAFKTRLIEMGFCETEKIRVIQKLPFKGPIQLRIRNAMVSLRYQDAFKIKVQVDGG